MLTTKSDSVLPIIDGSFRRYFYEPDPSACRNQRQRYGRSLGLVPEKPWISAGEGRRLPPTLGRPGLFLQHGSFQIELFEYQAPKPLPPDRLHPNLDLQTIGTKHIAFGVPDLAALKEALCANGVEIAHEITMGQDHILFIRDCCGTLIELIQVKAPAESD